MLANSELMLLSQFYDKKIEIFRTHNYIPTFQ